MKENNPGSVKVIIFDLGNVLIDFDHMIAARRLSGLTDKTERQIFDLFFNSEITGLFEEGKISPADFFLKVKEMLDLKIPYTEFVPIWNEVFFFSEKNLQVYNLVSALKKSYRLALLSNINILHFEYIKRNFSILDAFDNIFTSFELGLRKPEVSIYQKTLDALGTLPEEVFYVDDRPELVESAKSLGIKAFLFRDSEKLKQDFLAADIYIN